MISNTYAGGTLDRAAHLRRDADFLATAWQRPDARLVPLWRGQCLVAADGARAALLTADWPMARDFPWAWLGLAAETTAPVFALDLSTHDQPLDLLPPDIGALCDLRAAAAALPMAEAALLAYGRALLDWRRRARFCGLCGAPTRAEQAGHVAVCTGCAAQFFPRTDPTVIMLVTHRAGAGEERALLGHNARFPARRMFSTLAGFVEPGESLEEAVAREVMEEAGIAIGPTHYHSSQPWPFPANLMIGFAAEALGTKITIDADELLEARWFTRAALRDPVAQGIDLPPRLSIARRMIDDWLNAGP